MKPVSDDRVPVAGEQEMIHLKPVLSVRELPPVYSRLRQVLPSLREYVAVAPDHEERQILHYLQQGVCCGLIFDRGLYRDVLRPGNKTEEFWPSAPREPALAGPLENGSTTDAKPIRVAPEALLTDGVWVWLGALLYYVATYHVRLNPDFVRHAKAMDWRIDSSTIDVKNLNWDEVDRPC